MDLNNAERERNRRNNGEFGARDHTAPEAELVTAPPRVSAAERRRAARRERAGDGPFAEAIYDIDGAPVTIPTRAAGRTIVGASAIQGVMDGPMDGYRVVVYADGTTGQVPESELERDLPPLPGPRDENVAVVQTKATQLQPGDIVVGISDDGPTYRQVLTSCDHIAINDGFRRRVDVVFADSPDAFATYQNVDVEIVER
ncbi:hypothetical protein [uncultured Microbacterium sp.]|uniref:hypothetical protein n=1 Tax=uncultured Microbacterium sp. TaxID=191216 RepID=UPI0026304045|nr:hypothetical protein [uncultured Microbacterium sp.]